MSELDDFAESMETEIDRYLGKQIGSDNYVEVSCAVDKSVGDYPQAAMDESKEYLEDDGDLYHDRFPTSLHEPILLKTEAEGKMDRRIILRTVVRRIPAQQQSEIHLREFRSGKLQDVRRRGSRQEGQHRIIYLSLYCEPCLPGGYGY